LQSGPRIFKLLNLCGNQLISIYPSCLCICSFCFLGKCTNSCIWNDIGRNCLLGHRKKIAKFLMRTFTCRSTGKSISNFFKGIVICILCFLRHCFFCRPLDFTMSEDAGIDTRAVATILHGQGDALITRLDVIQKNQT
jgi:hypothetical protein